MQLKLLLSKRRVLRQEEAHPSDSDSNPYTLRGKVIRYDNPTEPVALEDWEVLQ